MTSFFPQNYILPECKPEWNREAITVFSRLPSLRRLQATPLLQPSLDNGQYYTVSRRTPDKEVWPNPFMLAWETNVPTSPNLNIEFSTGIVFV